MIIETGKILRLSNDAWLYKYANTISDIVGFILASHINMKTRHNTFNAIYNGVNWLGD